MTALFCNYSPSSVTSLLPCFILAVPVKTGGIREPRRAIYISVACQVQGSNAVCGCWFGICALLTTSASVPDLLLLIEGSEFAFKCFAFIFGGCSKEQTQLLKANSEPSISKRTSSAKYSFSLLSLCISPLKLSRMLIELNPSNGAKA